MATALLETRADLKTASRWARFSATDSWKSSLEYTRSQRMQEWSLSAGRSAVPPVLTGELDVFRDLSTEGLDLDSTQRHAVRTWAGVGSNFSGIASAVPVRRYSIPPSKRSLAMFKKPLQDRVNANAPRCPSPGNESASVVDTSPVRTAYLWVESRSRPSVLRSRKTSSSPLRTAGTAASAYRETPLLHAPRAGVLEAALPGVRGRKSSPTTSCFKSARVSSRPSPPTAGTLTYTGRPNGLPGASAGRYRPVNPVYGAMLVGFCTSIS